MKVDWDVVSYIVAGVLILIIMWLVPGVPPPP